MYVGLQEPLSISKWAAATHLKAMSNDTQQEALLPPDLDLQISDIAVGLNISCVEGRVVVAKPLLLSWRCPNLPRSQHL